MSDLERIEAAMEEKVRPALRSHGGDISIDHVEGKTVYVKLLGQCAGCPSADLTNETIVEAELKAALPDLVEKGGSGPDRQRRAVGTGEKAFAGPPSVKSKEHRKNAPSVPQTGAFILEFTAGSPQE